MEAFPTQAATKASFCQTAPQAVTLPAELLEPKDDGARPVNPIVIGTTTVGKTTPMLYPFTGDPYSRTPWIALLPPDLHIPPGIYRPADLAQCTPDNTQSSISTMTATASTIGSNLSSSKEREKTKDRMTN